MSALNGDNVIKRSELTWYSGPTLLGFLESVQVRREQEGLLRLPIQWVNRPNANFRGFSGTVATGSVVVGQSIRALPSGELANIKEILLFDQSFESASEGKAITVTLDRE